MTTCAGGCLCGDVRLRASGEPLRVGICHGPDCRRHHGALIFAAAIFAREAVAIEGEACDDAGRHCCPRCGSSAFARSGEELEVHPGSLDAPGQTVPICENWMVRRDGWLPPFPLAHHYGGDREGSGPCGSSGSKAGGKP